MSELLLDRAHLAKGQAEGLGNEFVYGTFRTINSVIEVADLLIDLIADELENRDVDLMIFEEL